MSQIGIKNFRLHGEPPYSILCVHGGPGAAGSLFRLAHDLSKQRGLIEPFQTKSTIAGQIAELKQIIADLADFPVVLIGHSWGAWLSYLFSSENPELVKKLIMIGAGPFRADYVPAMMKTRKKRLKFREKSRLEELLVLLGNTENPNDRSILSELGTLMEKTDNYCLMKLPDLELENNKIIQKLDPGIFSGIMSEASGMRRSGALLKAGSRIACPVIAIHGDHDPHPAAGVKDPLSKIIKDFRFYLLERCGHEPWREKFARKEFYGILEKEIAES